MIYVKNSFTHTLKPLLVSCSRYKSPFLRGDMDTSIDKHEKIEELMADDLENWLCNLYFEVVKLPRYGEKLSLALVPRSYVLRMTVRLAYKVIVVFSYDTKMAADSY